MLVSEGEGKGMEELSKAFKEGQAETLKLIEKVSQKSPLNDSGRDARGIDDPLVSSVFNTGMGGI